MQNYYELNVALNGRHLFATAARSCGCIQEAKRVWDCLKVKFPEAEGYAITITKWEATGTEMKWE